MVEKTSLTMEERLVTAFVSMIVAGLTIAVVGIGTFLRSGGSGPELESWGTFFRISGILCAAAGLLGFAVGPERMARHFGFLWGTEKPTTVQVAVLVTVVLGICGYALFGWPRWL